jgi:transmembrane sensor
VVLDDGSVIDLSTNTQIRVRFSAARRQILLDRGEALFSVAHDASRPFEVTALGVTARAVGTKFSVRLHEDARVETLVTEGRVLVLRQSEVLGVPMAPRPIGHTLVAGERVVVTKRAAVVSKVGPKLTVAAVDHGQGGFRKQPLADVVRELNRYTNRRW